MVEVADKKTLTSTLGFLWFERSCQPTVRHIRLPAGSHRRPLSAPAAFGDDRLRSILGFKRQTEKLPVGFLELVRCGRERSRRQVYEGVMVKFELWATSRVRFQTYDAV